MIRRPSHEKRFDERKLLKDYAEEELLALAKDLDEAALSELYDRYELKIYSYVYRRTSDQALAEDLTGDLINFPIQGWSTWLVYLLETLEAEVYNRDLDPDHPEEIEAVFGDLGDALTDRLAKGRW